MDDETVGQVLTYLFALMLVAGINHGCLQKDRKTKWYREDEVMIKADSLLNNWAKWEMQKDSL